MQNRSDGDLGLLSFHRYLPSPPPFPPWPPPPPINLDLFPWLRPSPPPSPPAPLRPSTSLSTMSSATSYVFDLLGASGIIVVSAYHCGGFRTV